MNSPKTKLFLKGYSPIGVSPDGEDIAVRRTENGKTSLFSLDLAKPTQMVLLAENVETDESVWFPGTQWIGFIAKKDGIGQVFIIHPDGSELTQVTKSPIGALTLESVFNDGVFWGEGPGINVQRYKWTRLDGTEKTYSNFEAVSPSGKYILEFSMQQDPGCQRCSYDMIFVATGETRKISLSIPKSALAKGLGFNIIPLSDEIWLLRMSGSYATESKYWIYSDDGKLLLDFATLPHNHDNLSADNENTDFYTIIGDGVYLSGLRLSPDNNWLMIQRWQRTNSITERSASYLISHYLLNLSSFEIQPLSNLGYQGFDFVKGFWWVELPVFPIAGTPVNGTVSKGTLKISIFPVAIT
jgi:hypothetical protein